MTNATTCPPADIVAALIEGEATDSERNRFEQHIDSCDSCSRLMSELVAIAPTSAPGYTAVALDATVQARRSFGRYELRSRIGAGGMGEVWLAWDPQLRREVAIKRVIAALDERARARFIQEARAMAAVAHPNVVAVYDVGEDNGEIFIATEFIKGQNLAEWQRGRAFGEVLDAYLQAGDGLAAAHAVGIVHRDVKPSNILVGNDGRVRIGDFGIARHEQADATASTQSGQIIGTPGYMAPEQWLGERADHRTDQYALAIAIVEAANGKRPQSDRPVVASGSLTKATATILTRALSADPAQRYAAMHEFVNELRAVQRDDVQAAKPRARLFALLAAALVVAAAFGATVWWTTQAKQNAQQVAAAPPALSPDATIAIERPDAAVTAMATTQLVDAAPPSRVAPSRGMTPIAVKTVPRPPQGIPTVIGSAATPKSAASGATPTPTGSVTTNDVIAAEHDLPADDPAARKARQLRDNGDYAGCTAAIGSATVGKDSLTRVLLFATCEQGNGKCAAGEATLRATMALAADPFPTAGITTWVENHNDLFCPVWDKVPVATTLRRLAKQGSMPASVRDARFIATLESLASEVPTLPAAARKQFFTALHGQIYRHGTIRACKEVTRLVEIGVKVGFTLNPDEFPIERISCPDLARLDAPAP